MWQRSRGRFIRGLNLPAAPETYVGRLEAGLTAGLAALAEAVRAGAVAVEDGELRLPRRKPAPRDPRVDPARQALALAVGNAQLTEVITEIDHLTRFSWTLLGRPARSEFRIEILDLLNQGEAVHSLQRAVYNGVITAKHGRTIEELGAISGALTLLANIVMAWNAHRLQIAIDRAPGEYPDEVLKGIAPIGHKHINLRGILTFDLSQLGASLLGRPPAAQKRASS